MAYSLPSFPEIDYARHAAYGDVLPHPSLAQRLRALVAFARGLALVTGRWLADYEHLPKPEDKARKLRWMAARLPKYLCLVVAQRWRLWTAGQRHVPRSATGLVSLRKLQTDGAMALFLSESERDRMLRMLAPHYARLELRLAGLAPQQRRFDDNRLWIDDRQDPAIYALFTALLEGAGVMEAAQAYLQRPVGVAHVIAQINTPDDDFWGRHFNDLGGLPVVCDYFHFDTAYRVLKVMVFPEDVHPDNGPFSFVLGSHRAARSFFDGIVRRANDYAGLSSTRRAQRELFMALPSVLQRKAAFGPDIPPDSPYVRPILDNEWVITADQGHCVVFDPQGIHRGGMVRVGKRHAVTLMLAESLTGAGRHDWT